MTSPAGRLLTAEHYREQVALRARMLQDALALWRVYVPGQRGTWDRMLALAGPVLRQRHAQSAASAARYFERLAAIEVGAGVTPVMPPDLDDKRVAATFAVTGLVSVRNARQGGLSMDAARRAGLVTFSGAFSRLGLEGGRSALTGSISSSLHTTGYRRVTSSKPCSFCSGLAQQPSGPEAFRAHDHCSCMAEPLFVTQTAAGF